MFLAERWTEGQKIIVTASDINHEDKKEITLEYKGNGYLEDVKNGNTVQFNPKLYPYVTEGMSIVLGLTHNTSICETYSVTQVL
jgi:sorbitol-specific phosphotransferase system component IIA